MTKQMSMLMSTEESLKVGHLFYSYRDMSYFGEVSIIFKQLS